MDDVLFTFDIIPFQNAMKTMSSGINMMIKRIAMIGAGFLSVRKALSFMPEVGKAFQIAGDIIGRNLLNPLRQQLIPLLQGMLDWVRDHRAMFVRWGTYLVNIFRIISNIVKGFISLLNRMWERLASNLERIFGKTTKTISEVVNVILFKISAITSFIMILLEPVFDFIVDAFSATLESATAFFGGMLEGFGNIFEPLDDLIEMLGEVGKMLGFARNNSSSWLSIMRTLGAVVGGTVRIALEGLMTAIDGIILGIKSLISGVKFAKAFITGDKQAMDRIRKENEEAQRKFEDRSKKRTQRVQQAFSRTTNVIQRETGIGETTTATKTSNVNVGPMTVNVTEGNAEQAGRNYAKGLQDQLINQDVLSGGRR